MTFLASPALFGALIFAAMTGVAAAVVILAVLIVRDWRRQELW
jgi:hypothetical protein